MLICEPDQTCFSRFPRSSSDSRLARILLAPADSPFIIPRHPHPSLSRLSLTAGHLLVLLQHPPPPSAALVFAIPHSNTPATSTFPVSLKKNRDAKRDRDSPEPLYRTIPSLAVLSTSYRPSYDTGHTRSLLFLFPRSLLTSHHAGSSLDYLAANRFLFGIVTAN